MPGTILIIDDKVKLSQSLAKNFEQRGYQTFCAANRAQGLALCAEQPINVVLLDIMLGDDNGLEVLQQLLLQHKHLPVIMITGYGSIDTAVQAIKLGACDYVTKPLEFEKLLALVENALHRARFGSESRQAQHPPGGEAPQIITQNKRMLELYAKAQKLAVTDLPILLTGENGTGKEIIADFIHRHSLRRAQSMLKINCAAFPETLLDNELFGHAKGAYTGADAVFKGVFERAHGSSLFLDEIGDMSLSIQAKILRTLQNHEIRRIGGDQTITVDVRFIAATNKPLADMIRNHLFREDLFYRLNTAMLAVPPLRERKEDIPLLAAHFLAALPPNDNGRKRLSDAVLAQFSEYSWPGNVRELKNTVNYAVAVVAADLIDLDDLPPQLSRAEPMPESDNIRAEMEKNLILKMLQKANYNKKKAAELLNMSRKTLYNKLEKYGIVPPKKDQ